MPVRPPKLTRREFLRNKPVNPIAGRTSGQRYQAYLNAYQRKYGAVKRQVPGQAIPTLASLLGQVGQFETPAQLEARANRMAQAGIKAQQALIREEADRLRNEAKVRAESMAAAGRAAAAQNAGLFGMVGGEYNAAAGEIAGLGTNLSNQMVNTTEGQVLAQNAGLASVGAPEMAVGGPAGTNSIAGAPQGAVSAYQFGNLPAQAITSTGAANQFGLAGMVAAQNLRATQEGLAGQITSDRETNAKRMEAIRALAAGRPADVAKYLQQLQDAQRQQISLAAGLIAQRAAMQQQGFNQSMTKKEYGQKVKQQKVQNQMAWAEIALKQQGLAADLAAVDMERSLALGYVVDKNGKPILKNGKRIPWKTLLRGATKSTGRTASMTPGQRVELIQQAQQSAENWLYGYKVVDGKRVPATQSPDFDPNNRDTWGNGGLDYRQGVQRLIQMGLTPGAAQQILNTYYQRGDDGRPIFASWEMKALKKMLGAKKFQWAWRQIQDLEKRGQWDARDALINQVLGGGQGIAWVGPNK